MNETKRTNTKRIVVLASCVAALLAGIGLLRPAGNEAVAAAPRKPEAPPAVTITPPPTSLQPAGEDPKPPSVPAGWKVETVMIHPKINTPSVVCAIPDGRVLVAEHWLSNVGGKDPVDRILCIHPDGKITLFADKLYAVFGLQYVDGKVFVHHYPVFSVFTDGGAEAKDRKDIINQTGKATIGGLNDHIAAQIRLAMDGYFYMSVGDRGVWGAKSNVDGREAELPGGGLLRIRPDGTGLEVYATGTRNHLDVSINAEDEMFTYDNTDDGHGWWTRFTHMVDGGFYGYPWDYRPVENKNDPNSKKVPKARDASVPYQPYTLWRTAEYQGGSPTGAVGYNEDALPEEYRGNLFHCEWGKGKVQRFVVERDGATYKVVKQQDFLTNAGKGGGDMRPCGIAVTPDGLGFYVTDWGYGGWMSKKEAGRLLKVTYTGKSLAAPKPAWFVPAAMGQKYTATTAELIEGLKHPAESVRLVAQRRITERGAEAVAPLTELLNDAKAPAHGRMFAVWTLDKIDSGKAGRAAIIAVAKDPKADVAVRRQAMRQLGERRAAEAIEAVSAGLSDADASVRFRAATALGRIGKSAAVPAILAKLDEKDPFARYAMFKALNRIGTADHEAWDKIVTGLASSNEAVRANTSYALRNTYDEYLVKALAQEVSTAEDASGATRAAALASLADLHRQPKPWAGNWWGTQPVGSPRPPKVVDWACTQFILETIRNAVGDGDPIVRQAAIRAMQIAPDPAAADTLVELFNKEKSVEMRKSVLEALAASKSPKGSDLVIAVLKDPAANADLVPAAIEVAQQTADKRSTQALVGLASGNVVQPPVLSATLQALGVLKDPSTGAVVARHIGSADDMVAMSSVNALGQIGGEPAVQALIAALTDKRPEIRRAAADGLSTLKTPAVAIPALIQAAKDKDADTARNALSALTKTPTLDALDAYLAAAGSKNAGMREKAVKALSALGDKGRAAIEAKVDTLSPETLAAVQAAYSSFQPLKIWSIVGPFPDDKPAPFDLAKLDKGAGEVKAPGGKTLKWKNLTTNDEHGMIDLAKAISSDSSVFAVLVAEFNSTTERDIDLLLGSDDTHTVYLNGQKIHDETGDSGWNFDAVAVRAKVKSGRNVLVARCGNNSGPWQFSVNVAAERKGKLFDAVATGVKKPDRDAFAKMALTAKGNASNGDKIFHNVNTVACIKCHQVSPTDAGGMVGPSLQGVGVKYDREKLIESVLYPSKQIFDGYQQSVVKTKDGDVIYGVIRSESEAEITLFDSAAQKTVVKKSDLVTRKLSEVSVMPEGLEQALTAQEFADLIAYLEGLKETPPEPPKAK